MGKRWYVGKRSAEGRAFFMVDLTKREAEIIRNFLDHQFDGPDEGYSGHMELLDVTFETRDQAQIYLLQKFIFQPEEESHA